MGILRSLLSQTSCVKQSIYCNTNMAVYMISDIDRVPSITPKVAVRFEVISSEEEFNKLIDIPEIKNHLWKFKRFLKNGCRLYLAFIDENLAGFYLITDLSKHKPYLFNNHPIFRSGSNSYIYYCRTFENYRNNGIYSYMLTQMCKDLLSYGKNIQISTDLDNSFSKKGIEKAGFTKIGNLRYSQIFIFVFRSEFITIDKTGLSQNSYGVH